MHPGHVAGQFKHLTDRDPLDKNIEKNFRTFLGIQKHFILLIYIFSVRSSGEVPSGDGYIH